jgi:hypothetical protein
METMAIRLTSSSPMLMHAATLANPLDKATKAHKVLTAITKKTDDIHLAIARSEYNASLYTRQGRVVIPTINLLSCFVAGAKLSKLGAQMQRSIMANGEEIPLLYKGPQDPDKLFDNEEFQDVRGVVVGRARVMRYRPKFANWKAEIELIVDTDMMDKTDVLRCAAAAGQYVGLGDFRPQRGGIFGRFSVEEVG